MRIFRYFLVLFIPLSFLIVGCSNDDFQEIKSNEDVSFLENKITLEEAKAVFEKQELQKLQKKRTQKNGYYLSLEPKWNEFSQGKTPFDIEFSSVPVKLFQSKVEGEVLFLRDNDTIKSYLFMLKKDKINEKGEVTDVRFYLFDTEGIFLDAYRINETGVRKLVFVRKSSITARSSTKKDLFIKATELEDWSGWDMGCGSTGGSGRDDDPYILSEVVVSAPYKNNNSNSYHSGAYYSSTYFNNLLSSNNNYHNSYNGSYQNDFVESGGGGSSSVSSNFNNFGVAIAIANQVGSDNDFIWELEDDERKFFNENFSIKKSFINFYKESRYSAEALNFLQETFNASKNVKFDFNEIFSIKRNNKSFNFIQAFTLLEINKIANPITGKPVEFYLLLKHKNPQYFDISSFSVAKVFR